MISEWSKLRVFNKSQNAAFEELVCQLARDENVPLRKVYTRVAAPDGGVEAYWVTEEGSEYGWQAKFFDIVGDSQWNQIGESLRRALQTHPRLRKYYICLPLDRQDPRKPDQKWFMDKWVEKVEIWKKYAASINIDLEIEYWGSSEIFHRLTLEHNSGRRMFWFNDIELSHDWFRN